MRKKHYAQSALDIEDYVERLLALSDDHDLDDALQNAAAFGTPPLQITPFDARHIEVLAKLLNPQKILEIGTLCGYSALSLCRALAPGGRLYTCERSSHHAQAARQFFENRQLSHCVTLLEGDFADFVPQLTQEGPFDVIFLDADKRQYPHYQEILVHLLRVGGLLLADNTFAFGHIADGQNFEDPRLEGLKDIVDAVRNFNERCAQDPRLRCTMLPTGEGLLAAIRVS